MTGCVRPERLMPRRRPGEVRATQLAPCRPAVRSVMLQGVSPYALAVITRLEQARDGWWPGVVGAALWKWYCFVRNPYRRVWVDYPDGGCGIFECCGSPWLARDMIEVVLTAMSPRSGRDLRRIVDRLDQMY